MEYGDEMGVRAGQGEGKGGATGRFKLSSTSHGRRKCRGSKAVKRPWTTMENMHMILKKCTWNQKTSAVPFIKDVKA